MVICMRYWGPSNQCSYTVPSIKGFPSKLFYNFLQEFISIKWYKKTAHKQDRSFKWFSRCYWKLANPKSNRLPVQALEVCVNPHSELSEAVVVFHWNTSPKQRCRVLRGICQMTTPFLCLALCHYGSIKSDVALAVMVLQYYEHKGFLAFKQ